MPEILTESFCERCGTRYTFESATPRGPRLKGLKVMSRGLKNFVLSDDTSMDEAMAAARNETDREQTSQQLDAFHKTFNFCMSCRQYTCGNCWNETDGRCLSCAPHLGHEVLQAPFGNVGAGGAITLTDSEAIGLNDRNGHEAGAPAPAEPMAWPEPEPMSWPTSDLMQEEGAQGPSSFQEAVDAAAELEADAAAAAVARVTEDVAAPFDELPVEVEAAAVEEFEAPSLEAAPSPIEEAVAPLLEREPEAVAPVEAPVAATPPTAAPPAPPVETVPPAPPIADQDRAAAAAANTSDLLRRFRPGQSLDDEIAAYEREQAAATGAAMAAAAEAAAAEADIAEAKARAAAEAAAAALPQPEPEIAATPEPEPVAPMPEPEPVAPMPELEPVAPMAEPEPVAPMPEPEPVAAEPAAAAWPEPVAAEPRDDVVYQPTWQIVAPEPPTAEPGRIPQAPAPTAEPIAASAEPQWPSQPEWPRPPSADGLPFLGRPAASSGGIEALWAESAREVGSVGPLPGAKPVGGVQPCVSCGLSLSANARFCRRCGTRQG
jgi:hypothetical protein